MENTKINSELEKLYDVLDFLSSVDNGYLEGNISAEINNLNEDEFEELCNEVGLIYDRVKYTFEITDGLNVKLIWNDYQ